jgi:hypothetical protein
MSEIKSNNTYRFHRAADVDVRWAVLLRAVLPFCVVDTKPEVWRGSPEGCFPATARFIDSVLSPIDTISI